MDESKKLTYAARLQAIQAQALSLVEQLSALTSAESPDRLPLLHDLIVQVQDLVTFCAADADTPPADKKNPAPTKRQLQGFWSAAARPAQCCGV